MICETVRNANLRTASNAKAVGITTGAMRVRKISASWPSAVAKLNARSVVATSRRAKPLRSIAVEQAIRRATGHDRRQFPGEVDGVADPGVHALAAGRAMDMRRVAG